MIKRFNTISIITYTSIILFSSLFFVFGILNNAKLFNDHPNDFKIFLTIFYFILSIVLTTLTYILTKRENLDPPKTKIMEIFDLIDDEIIIVNAKNLNFLFANQSLLNNTLYKKEDLLGKSIGTIYPDCSIEEIKQRLEPLFNTGIDSITYESIRTKKDGTTYQAIVKLKYFKDTNTFMSISHNISKTRELENLKNECISTFNHDIRTSLTKISGALKIIASGMVGEVPMTMSEMLNLANDNTIKLLDEMDNLINNENIKALK